MEWDNPALRSTRVARILINSEYPLSNYPPPPGVVSAPLALRAIVTDEFFRLSSAQC